MREHSDRKLLGMQPQRGAAGQKGRRKKRRLRRGVRRALHIIMFAAICVILVCVGTLTLQRLLGAAADAGTEAESSAPDSAAGMTQSEAQSEVQPTPDPEQAAREARYTQVQQAAALNATKDAPSVTDPALWEENGRALMQRLLEDSYYQEQGINISAKEGCDYLIAVNRAASTVTVYTLDEEGNYTVPYMAMVCSGGDDTPLGFYATPVSYSWRLLAGPCYGQYATRIWDAYLFHSVPYYTQHKDDLEYDQFNQLGTPASLGCIRLAVVDVKWIYDNCPIGTRVIIYDDADDPGPMGKPGTIYTDPSDETLRGWDPTDPDPANPWDEVYRSGTAIRSEAAQAEWDAAQADGRWEASLTPTDLQGWSHDSSVEGTRG